jgi:outer membrane protein insertion porin family/translocation and assembly module TamA
MEARRSVRAALLCVALLALPGAAGCKEEGAIQVASLDFVGVTSVEERQLRSVLATSQSSKLPWGDKRFFNREQFEADLKRIAAFYRDRGFPDARVKSFDVRLSPDQKKVDIAVTIDEGEPVRVERLEFDGFGVLPPDHPSNLQRRVPLKPGQPLDRALLQASREAVLDELRDHGYPYASVRIAESPGSGERLRVIAFHAEPGPIAYHGPIEISGNSSVSDDVIRRQLTFRPGDLFRQSRLLESQRKLYALEVFEFANIQPVRGEGQKPAEVPTRVTVTEGKHRKVNFSLGYGTEERARVEADWRHVNFFGGARTLGVLGRYSRLDRGARLSFHEPYFFSPRYSFTSSGQYWHNDEDSFWLDNVGGRVSVTRDFPSGEGPNLKLRPAMAFSLTYANEWEQYELSNELLQDLSLRDDLIAMGIDPRFGTGSGQRSSLSLDAGRNTTGNILDARHGYVASAHVEQAGKWLQGDYDYYEVQAEGRYYRTVAGRAVIAVRARAGSIDPLGVDVEQGVPFYKRYFLGGASSLRGWGRYEVAPLSGSGLPIGGHSTADFSLELRMPVWGNLGGVLFVDGGNVWTNPWDFNLGDLRYDVGPGLRYNTPIGPLRFDVAYQLNPIPGLLVNGEPESRRFRFHFSIGHAF